jgi:hypothetical protein
MQGTGMWNLTLILLVVVSLIHASADPQTTIALAITSRMENLATPVHGSMQTRRNPAVTRVSSAGTATTLNSVRPTLLSDGTHLSANSPFTALDANACGFDCNKKVCGIA